MTTYRSKSTERSGCLSQILGCQSTSMNSLHHQVIAELGDGVQAVGHDLDGIIQALKKPQYRFMFGVQWHPECLPVRSPQKAIFKALCDSARQP
jgi:putative glutamine amidotransferase